MAVTRMFSLPPYLLNYGFFACLAVNLIAPTAASAMKYKSKRRKYLSHAVALLLVVLSVFSLIFIWIHTNPIEDFEEPGPLGDGLILVPIFLEVALIIAVYVTVASVRMASRARYRLVSGQAELPFWRSQQIVPHPTQTRPSPLDHA